MRSRKMYLRKCITFDEWKAEKDIELKRKAQINLTAIDNDVDVKIGNPAVDELPKELPTKAVRQLTNKVEHKLRINPDELVVKKNGALSFNEWVHNKNILQQANMTTKRQTKIEKEKHIKDHAEQVEKAYNKWLVRSKYRTLRKYYPELSEEKVNCILLKDMTKLSIRATREIGVGDELENEHR